MTQEPSPEQARRDTEGWARAHWDPDRTVAEWWQLLADEGLTHPALPEPAGGRGWRRSTTLAAWRGIADADVLGPPQGLGIMLAAPTIVAHGTDEQIERWVPSILNGRDGWCQLFSEPGAGSDLAGLQTRAERDGDEWRVTGQKVWTSEGQWADLGMLLARTDPDLPKHAGITYFVVDMHQPGVDVRPLREMTGRAMFNEVFLDDARVADADRLGDLGEGWRVGNTTLAEERASLGAGSAGFATTTAGSVAGQLDRRVGDVLESRQRGRHRSRGVPSASPKLFATLLGMARDNGTFDDPVVRQALMRLHTRLELNRLNTLRARAGGSRSGAEPNIAKLTDAALFREFREVAGLVIGADMVLVGESSATGGFLQELALFSPGPAIYGGTDQIQRNIIGERVLGLPREPGPAKDTPFSQLPRN